MTPSCCVACLKLICNLFLLSFPFFLTALIIGLVSTPALDSIPPDAFGFVARSDTLAKNALNMFGWREVYAPIFLHQILELAGYVAPLSARSHAAKSGLENVKQFVQGGREKINKNKEL